MQNCALLSPGSGGCLQGGSRGISGNDSFRVQPPLPPLLPLFCGRQGPAAAQSRRASASRVGRCHVIRPGVGTTTFGPPQEALLTTDGGELEDAFDGFDAEVAYLQALVDNLAQARSLEAKVKIILAEARSEAFFKESSNGRVVIQHIKELPLERAYVLYCLPAMNQCEALSLPPADGDWSKALLALSGDLHKCDVFYDAIGGLVGYQLKVCQIIHESLSQEITEKPCSPADGGSADQENSQAFLQPPSLDLSTDQTRATAAAIKGLQALPEMAEVIPLGGAGDRLGLKCEETGQSLPTAMLPYCGRTLLESIIRDLQAREYLHYRVFGSQMMTPVAVMTSDAKGNHSRITELLQDKGWFGRGEGSFNLFCQPLVPVVSVENGKWLVTKPFQLMLKPGGHGVIWKLMSDSGVFDWLESRGREAALVRQISNPLAGTDTTLLALAGTGRDRGHAFGFASCERAVGAAEGMNVLVEERMAIPGGSERRYGITNVEYTEFERLGITDEASGDGASISMYPANTNILYVGLKQTAAQIRKGFVKGGGAVLPGMIFNLNKKVTYTDAVTGLERSIRAGRMECTMQNLADCFRTPLDIVPGNREEDSRALDTFLVYNLRRRTTSSAKRKRKPGTTKIHQTPDGSFFDLQRNASDLLAMCGMKVAELGDVSNYLSNGPGFIFLFHPALGPLWDVVKQKIRGGSLGAMAEMVLEVAEVDLKDVVVEDGSSLKVSADCVMGKVASRASLNGCADGIEVFGSPSDDILVYSNYCGRIRMHNVKVENRGIDWDAPDNCYWGHRVARKESCQIVLHGNAEFEALDCALKGNCFFEVPDGHRLRVTSGPDGLLVQEMELLAASPSWYWRCSLTDDAARIVLEMHSAIPLEKSF